MCTNNELIYAKLIVVTCYILVVLHYVFMETNPSENTTTYLATAKRPQSPTGQF